MKFRDLRRTFLLFIFLLGLFLFITVGCHTNKSEKSEIKKTIDIEDVRVIKVPEKEMKSKEEFGAFLKSINITGIQTIPPLQAVKYMKECVFKVLPFATGDNKENLNGIIKYLDSIKKPSDYFDDENNIIDFGQSVMQLTIIVAEIAPDDFDTNYQVAYQYINTGKLIESLGQSEEHAKISDKYREKGFQAAKDLVKKFPDHPKAYHQLAYFAYVVENNKKKALGLYKRCLELDSKLELCRKSYDDLYEDLDKEKLQ